MKFMHISDLHLGKRVMEYPMIEDQAAILSEIVQIAEECKPNALLIAGDVYDKTVPPADAVRLFDDFLVKISELNIPVFIISGNHDSSERLSFGSRLMEKSGVYFAPVYNGKTESVIIKDDNETVEIALLPFIKPSSVRRFAEEFGITVETYTDAVRFALSDYKRRDDRRLILLTHQFVTGATTSDSEELSVGGPENVDVSVFDEFDYVALGHIHRPQNCTSERVRYCGTPLKYSFSEVNDKKSVTIVEVDPDGQLTVNEILLHPIREMYELRGTYDELTLRSFWENTDYRDAYVHITLTDEDDIPDAIGKLRAIYHNLMKLDYDNRRTREGGELSVDDTIERKTPAELFADFYESQNNIPMSDEQKKLIDRLIEEIWGERA